MPEKPLPNYQVVPLRSDEITISVIQSTYRSVDIKNARQEIRQNLDHMLRFIDTVQARRQKDLLIFHEFPLQGSDISWTRQEQIKVAIEIPGEETEIIGQKAKQYNCYIEFGARGVMKDWPGHFLYLGLIVGPSGDLVHTRWKTRNMAGIGFTTTVYDVLDEYVARYGWDAVFPVARTDIGNLTILPETLEPEMGRAFAIKGAEIIIRYMTYGAGHWSNRPFGYRGGLGDTFRLDLQATCLQNSVYGVFVNNALVPTEVFNDYGAGRSAIIDHDGRIIAEAASAHETVLEAVIPIASFRKTHSIPKIPKELYTDLVRQYVSKYPPNSFSKSLPDTNRDSLSHYQNLARW